MHRSLIICIFRYIAGEHKTQPFKVQDKIDYNMVQCEATKCFNLFVNSLLFTFRSLAVLWFETKVSSLWFATSFWLWWCLLAARLPRSGCLLLSRLLFSLDLNMLRLTSSDSRVRIEFSITITAAVTNTNFGQKGQPFTTKDRRGNEDWMKTNKSNQKYLTLAEICATCHMNELLRQKINFKMKFYFYVLDILQRAHTFDGINLRWWDEMFKGVLQLQQLSVTLLLKYDLNRWEMN